MKKRTCYMITAAVLAGLCLPLTASAQSRREILVPDVPGYVTLKCDFHTHTVFSDGQVWPTVRVDEAWQEGLDAVSITDHIEYQPHSKDIQADHNRSYELARSRAAALGIILIRGTEVTRAMPPGHLNAVFIQDASALDKPDFMEVMEEAVRQGAFVMWNHPGWRGQQPDGVPRWYDVHTELLEKGWLHGIEVVNYNEYYPLAHDWCLEKNLAVIGNSDIHAPASAEYDYAAKERRPMTLVFAEERSEAAIRDALFAGRTAVLYKDSLIGREETLVPLVENALSTAGREVVLTGKGAQNLWLTNRSDIPFSLQADGETEWVSGPAALTVKPRQTVLFRVQSKTAGGTGAYRGGLPYKVTNVKTAGGACLRITVPVSVTLSAAADK